MRQRFLIDLLLDLKDNFHDLLIATQQLNKTLDTHNKHHPAPSDTP